MWKPDERSRSATDGTVRLPPHAMVLMRSGIQIWNRYPELRMAKSRAAVDNLVEKISKVIPI